MKIEIKGVQFVNKGAELMLHAVIQQLKKRNPNTKIVLAPNKTSPYEQRARLGALQKISLRKLTLDLNGLTYFIPKRIRQYLQTNWGLITEADIDCVLDASGFAYGDQFKEIVVAQMCSEVNRANRKQKPYIFLPQAFGPFSRSNDRKKLREALPNAALICAREESSFAHIEELTGKSPQLVQYPDFTNLVEGFCPDYFDNGTNCVVFIPNSNMLSSRNSNSDWITQYLRVFSALIEMVYNEGFEPVLLNHEGEADEKICLDLTQQFPNIKTLHETDPLAVKGIIGASKAVVCSRFHGCVSALTQSIPSLATSWSHKYERLYQEYDQSDSLISSTASEADLQQLLSRLLSGELKPDSNKVAEYKAMANAMWDSIAQTINIAGTKSA